MIKLSNEVYIKFNERNEFERMKTQVAIFEFLFRGEYNGFITVVTLAKNFYNNL